MARAFVDPVLGIAGPPREVPRPERATLADLIALVPLDNEALRPHLRAKLGGVIIDPALYRRVLPKQDAFVTIVLPVHGGKNGILGTLAVLALVGASIFVGGAGLPFLGTAFAAGSVGANLVAGGLSLAATLLLQGLSIPQQQAEGSAAKEIGVASAQNSFEPGAYLQRVVGTRRIPPQMVAPPFTQIDGDDQIVTAVYGLAGPHQIADLMVNGAIVDDTTTDFTFEIREGFADDAALTLVTDTRVEIAQNLKLSQFRMATSESATNEVDTSISPYEPQWHRMQTKRAPDTARLFLTFDQGLIYTYEDDTAIMALRLRIRRRGTSTWFNLPEFLVRGEKQGGALRLHIDFKWLDTADMPSSVTGFSDTFGGWYKMYQSVEKTTVPTAVYWTADAYFATNKIDRINQQRLHVYLDNSIFPQTDAYEIEVIRGYSTRGNAFTPSSSVMHVITDNGITLYDFFAMATVSGRQYVPNRQEYFIHSLVVPAIQSIWDEAPFDLTNQPTALIAIRARNRSLDQVTCLASGYVEDWNGAAWVADQVTSNPASHYRDVLRGELNAVPTPDSLMDTETLQDWHEWCAAEGWEVNAVIAGQPVSEVLSLIAQAGMARPKFGAVYGVVIDRPREPVNLISQRNAAGFAFQKPFGRLPHALRVNLSDENADYVVREVIVYDDGYAAVASGGLLEATRFESVTYQGLTSEALVTRRAARDMRFARWRSRLITFTVDIEHLEYGLGDLVLLETDILGQMGGRGRVRAITTGGGLVTGLTLDEERDFTKADADGAQRAVAMRLMDGTVRVEQVTGDDTDLTKVVFSTPFAMPVDGSGDLIVPGVLVVTGAHGQEAREVLIWDIAPGPDLTAQITTIPYAGNEIYGPFLLLEDGGFLLLENGDRLILEQA
jgi:hypothetical protein